MLFFLSCLWPPALYDYYRKLDSIRLVIWHNTTVTAEQDARSRDKQTRQNYSKIKRKKNSEKRQERIKFTQTWPGAAERQKLSSLYSPLCLSVSLSLTVCDSLPSLLLSAAQGSSQEMNGSSQRTVVLANDLPRSHDPLNVGWAGGWRLHKQEKTIYSKL